MKRWAVFLCVLLCTAFAYAQTPTNLTGLAVQNRFSPPSCASVALNGFSAATGDVCRNATTGLPTAYMSGAWSGMSVQTVYGEPIFFQAAACGDGTNGTSSLDRAGVNPPATCVGTNSKMGVLSFDAAADEVVYAHFTLPLDWDSSELKFLVDWGDSDASAANTSTDDVYWGIQVSCASDNASYDPTWNTATVTSDTVSTTSASLRYSTGLSATITSTGCAAGRLMHIKVYRDADNAADVYPADARMFGFVLYIRRTNQ